VRPCASGGRGSRSYLGGRTGSIHPRRHQRPLPGRRLSLTEGVQTSAGETSAGVGDRLAHGFLRETSRPAEAGLTSQCINEAASLAPPIVARTPQRCCDQLLFRLLAEFRRDQPLVVGRAEIEHCPGERFRPLMEEIEPTSPSAVERSVHDQRQSQPASGRATWVKTLRLSGEERPSERGERSGGTDTSRYRRQLRPRVRGMRQAFEWTSVGLASPTRLRPAPRRAARGVRVLPGVRGAGVRRRLGSVRQGAWPERFFHRLGTGRDLVPKSPRFGRKLRLSARRAPAGEWPGSGSTMRERRRGDPFRRPALKSGVPPGGVRVRLPPPAPEPPALAAFPSATPLTAHRGGGTEGNAKGNTPGAFLLVQVPRGRGEGLDAAHVCPCPSTTTPACVKRTPAPWAR
jgi:hypothetical protein